MKQDAKKAINQQYMQMGIYAQPPMPGPPQMPVNMPATLGHDQGQSHLSVAPGFYPVTADISPATIPIQGMDRPTNLDIGPAQQQMLIPHYDSQQSLRSIPEANQRPAYNPNIVLQHIMAASEGQVYMQNNGTTMQPQAQNYAFESNLPNGLPNGLPNDTQFSMSTDLSTMNTMPVNENDAYGEYLSYLPFISTGQDSIQINAGSLSADDSPFSGAQSNGTNPSSIEPNPGSVASLTSKYSGWTDTNGDVDTKQENETEDFFSYNMPQASASDANFYVPNHHSHSYSVYSHSNASAHAILSSPHQSGRSISTGPADFEPPNFGDEVFGRRNSSTSNLATDIGAIHIQNSTPEGFHSPNQSSIAARRQKRPTALNSNTLRSASYSGSAPSPGNNNGDHTLRRIRSGGLGGRVEKRQPSSAQRSPMSLSFSEAASSPKFQRAMSSSSITTVGNAGNRGPPTPQTPNDRPFPSWQTNPVIRNAFGTNWATEGQPNGFMNSESPPSLEAAQLHQARLGGEMYRDTPPQSAPASQQGFPNGNTTNNMMQPPKMRAAFHSSTDLTLQHPKPSHFRRPSLPVDAQGQSEDPNAMYSSSYGGLKYDDYNSISLSGIQHNVPFAPPVSAMPDFLVNQYVPPGDGIHGHMRRTTAPEAKNYIFANQGPRDFRSGA